MTAADPLPAAGPRLRPGDAVAALILVEKEGYLMQLRDDRTDIWYPGYWGLFGGAIDAGEEPTVALARELREELEFELAIERATFFARFDFALPGLGLARYARLYYVLPITHAEARGLVLHEGAAMRVFPGEEVLGQPRVTPYDSFVLFLHHARARLSGSR